MIATNQANRVFSRRSNAVRSFFVVNRPVNGSAWLSAGISVGSVSISARLMRLTSEFSGVSSPPRRKQRRLRAPPCHADGRKRRSGLAGRALEDDGRLLWTMCAPPRPGNVDHQPPA